MASVLTSSELPGGVLYSRVKAAIRQQKAEEVPDSALTRRSRLLAGSDTVVWRLKRKGCPRQREANDTQRQRVPERTGTEHSVRVIQTLSP